MPPDDPLRTHAVLLDPSFVVRCEFEAFLSQFVSAGRGSGLAWPAQAPDVLLQMAAAFRTSPRAAGACRRAADLLDRADRLERGRSARPDPGFATASARALRAALRGRDPDRLAGPEERIDRVAAVVGAVGRMAGAGATRGGRLLVLTGDGNTVSAVEGLAAGNPGWFRSLGYGLAREEVEPRHPVPEVEWSWYPRPRRGWWSRLFARAEDPLVPFAETKELEPVPATARPDPDRDDAGAVLRDDAGGRWRLRRRIKGGGEGVVYEAECLSGRPPDGAARWAAKVYPDPDDGPRAAKLRRMASRPVPDPMVCWPRRVLADRRGGAARGFVMPLAPAGAVPLTNFLLIRPTDPDALARWRRWTRRDTAELALTWLSRVRALERLNVRLGDVQPNNLLVRDARTVALIDCDSYQVERYPCAVGTPEYFPPEVLGHMRVKGVGRGQVPVTAAQERFSVAVLLFKMLMPNLHPYSHRGGGTPEENTLRGVFPFDAPADGRPPARHRLTPDGRWHECWSHLTPGLRALFRRAFVDGHPRRVEGGRQTWDPGRTRNRPGLGEWADALQTYSALLGDPARRFRGPARGYDLNPRPLVEYLEPLPEPDDSPS